MSGVTQGNIVPESEAEKALGSDLYRDLGEAPAPRKPLDPNAPAFVPKTGSSKKRKGKGRKTSKKAARKARKTRRR